MTTKTFTLTNSKVKEISKGMLLKKNEDMFIVAEVARKQVEDSIHNALYNNKPYNPTSYSYNPPKVHEAKYALISLGNGVNYFDSQLTLQELLMKVSRDGRFELVSSVEIIEN